MTARDLTKPATLGDLQPLKSDISELKADVGVLKADVAVLKSEMHAGFAALEERMAERMRDMQTELLRGFESFATSQTVRLRKLEIDHRNLDATSTDRLGIVEERLRQIEMKLGLAS